MVKNLGFFILFCSNPWKNLRKIKVLCLWGPCPRAKGVLAGPGTPRDPKSNVFVTKWVAINRLGRSTRAWMRNFSPELAR